MFNLFSKKKAKTVNLNDYAAAYENTPGVILDNENLLVILVREDGIVTSRQNVTVAGHDTGDTGVFENADEIIAHYNIVNPAVQARVRDVVAVGDQI